jgi:Txe/YoeB family toxin of Txe-Axe toxin-antitoxin module
MTGEEMERAIEFLINHHAKVSSDIEGLKEAQMRTAANIASLVEQAEADRREMRETFENMTGEMRDGFNKLILSNEVTRDLSNQVARLAIATAQRVTALEDKLSNVTAKDPKDHS